MIYGFGWVEGRRLGRLVADEGLHAADGSAFGRRGPRVGVVARRAAGHGLTAPLLRQGPRAESRRRILQMSSESVVARCTQNSTLHFFICKSLHLVYIRIHGYFISLHR